MASRIKKETAKVRPTAESRALQKDLHSILADYRPRIAGLYRQTVEIGRKKITHANIGKAIIEQNLKIAYDEINAAVIGMQLSFGPQMRELMARIYAAGGGREAEYATAKLVDRGAPEIIFQPFSANAEAYLTQRGDLLKGALFNVKDRPELDRVVKSLLGEKSVPTATQRLREVVGLREQHIRAVDNFFRGQLAAGASDKAAGDRALKYADRLIRVRADGIARTESMGALNAGRMEMWREVFKDPEVMLDRGEATRTWQAADDSITCPICLEMDGQEIPFDGVWILPDGSETDTPQGHDVGCRCTEIINFPDTKKSVYVLKYDDGEPCDEHGRWTAGGTGYERGDDKIWRDKDGKPAPDDHQARIKAMAIPPAWKDVRLNPDEKADLQVLGRDSKGRQQYRYSTEHSERQAAAKFDRIRKLDKELPKIDKALARDLKTSEEAAALRLIEKTAFRPGSDRETGGKVKAYGITTLQSEHVKIDGDKISLSFIGKEGVLNEKTIEDKELARVLSPKVAAGGRVFDTNDSKVRDYMHSIDGPFKVKDLRTWNGTNTARAVVDRLATPTNSKEYARAQKEVAKAVAEHLGNTPAVALKSYIDPAVFSKWKGAAMAAKKSADDDDWAAKIKAAMAEVTAGGEALLKSTAADYFETVSYYPPSDDGDKIDELGTSDDED